VIPPYVNETVYCTIYNAIHCLIILRLLPQAFRASSLIEGAYLRFQCCLGGASIKVLSRFFTLLEYFTATRFLFKTI
jgi:hypothetical protein